MVPMPEKVYISLARHPRDNPWVSLAEVVHFIKSVNDIH